MEQGTGPRSFQRNRPYCTFKRGLSPQGGQLSLHHTVGHLSPQHLVILVLAGDVAEWTWISIGLSACTQKLRHLDVIHLHLWFLIIFFHNDLILRTLSPKGSPPIQGDLEGLLFDNYLLTIIDIHTFLSRFAIEAAAVQRVPCIAVEADFTGLGVDGSDGCDITVSIHKAYRHP